jgi:hypothetical protein
VTLLVIRDILTKGSHAADLYSRVKTAAGTQPHLRRVSQVFLRRQQRRRDRSAIYGRAHRRSGIIAVRLRRRHDNNSGILERNAEAKKI